MSPPQADIRQAHQAIDGPGSCIAMFGKRGCVFSPFHLRMGLSGCRVPSSMLLARRDRLLRPGMLVPPRATPREESMSMGGGGGGGGSTGSVSMGGGGGGMDAACRIVPCNRAPFSRMSGSVVDGWTFRVRALTEAFNLLDSTCA